MKTAEQMIAMLDELIAQRKRGLEDGVSSDRQVYELEFAEMYREWIFEEEADQVRGVADAARGD